MKTYTPKELQKIRKANEWTVPQMASCLGVPQKTLENWLSGRTAHNPMLHALLEKLGEK